jgi:hypothetical protein
MTPTEVVDEQLDQRAKERVMLAEREREAYRRREVESLTAQVEAAEADLQHAEGQGATEAVARLNAAIAEREARLPGVPYRMETDPLNLALLAYVRFRQNLVQRHHQFDALRARLRKAEEGPEA